jgi:ferric-dicitrate binding protein FerR (iron transport regulator)
MGEITKIRELCRRYFDGLLAAGEREELQALIQNSPEAADEFARLSRLEADLSELFAHELDIRRESGLIDAIQRQHRRRVWLGRLVKVAVAACLLLAVLVPIWWWLTQTDDISPNHSGNEVVSGEIEHDDGVARVVSAEAVLKLADGSRVSLTRGSEIVLPPEWGRSVELRSGQGRFTVQVNESDGQFVVETPVGRVIALGTEFSIQLNREEEEQSMKMTHFVMAVAVLSGVVQVETGEQKYVLLGGESRAFAEEKKRDGEERKKDGERRPNVRTQKGTVLSAGDGKLTLAGGDRRNGVTLDVAETTKVFIDGKAAKLSDLTKGMLVSIERGTKDGDPVVSIRAEGPTIAAVIKSVSKDKVTVQGRGREGRNAEEVEYPLIKDAKITIDGKPGAAADLKAGDRVGLGLSSDRKSVLSIVKGFGDRDGEKPVRGQRAGGEVTKVDADKNTIAIKTEGDDREFSVSKDARITIDGKAGKLADIKSGTRVMLVLDRDGKTATAVTVGGDRDGEKGRPRPTRIQGKVKGAEKSDSTITLFGKGDNPDDQLFMVAKDAKITIDGKPAKLEDIKENMNAILILSEDKKSVKEITSTPARKRGDREKKEGDRKEEKKED